MNAIPLRRRVCVHESAHALATLYHCLPLAAVEIDPDGRGGRNYTPNTPGPARASMFIALAGREAENLFCGINPQAASAHAVDFDLGWRAATHYARGNATNAARALSAVRADVAAFVHQNADLINAVAAELDRRGALTGADVQAIARATLAAR